MNKDNKHNLNPAMYYNNQKSETNMYISPKEVIDNLPNMINTNGVRSGSFELDEKNNKLNLEVKKYNSDNSVDILNIETDEVKTKTTVTSCNPNISKEKRNEYIRSNKKLRVKNKESQETARKIHDLSQSQFSKIENEKSGKNDKSSVDTKAKKFILRFEEDERTPIKFLNN